MLRAAFIVAGVCWAVTALADETGPDRQAAGEIEKALTDIGVDYAQGFGVGRPVPFSR